MKFGKIRKFVSAPVEKLRMMNAMRKTILTSDAKFRMAVIFGGKTIEEAERAVKERTFNDEQKKFWKKEILKKYIGRKCPLYPYAADFVKRIKAGTVNAEDYWWLKTELIPMFKSDMDLYNEKLDKLSGGKKNG